MLIFDFDGVLINSIDEVMVTAYNSVTHKNIRTMEQVPADPAALFKQNRFHVQPVGDVIPLMEWCLNNYQLFPGKLLTDAEYQEVLQNNDVPQVDRTNHFFGERRSFVENDLNAWLSFHSPYEPLWRELMQRDNSRIIFLTNKNREAVQILCDYFGLAVHKKNIYSGDSGVTKWMNLSRIHQRFQRDRYYLVDDSVKNLRELELHFNTRIPLLAPIFAVWGYTGPLNKKQALEYGYPVFRQKDLIDILDREFT
jgi:hypothetical protein